MKLWKFDTYDEYVNAQIKGTERRKRRNQRAGTDLLEVQMIQSRLKTASHIMCHGAGNGVEVGLFKKQYPGAVVIGTDLVKWGQDVVVWDFNKPNPEWKASFDFIYTNSMDHSPDPSQTIKVWLEQLKPEGSLLVQWNNRHAIMEKSDTIFVGGDCFTSHLDEFILLFSQSSKVVDLVYIPSGRRRHSGFRVVLVVRPLT
jgi:hypothetical protein